MNYCKAFPNSRGCVAQKVQDALDQMKAERRERADLIAQRAEERTKRLIALTLDELRTIVFETSVAYSYVVRCVAGECAYTQEAEWARAAALKTALERLGYEREAEMIGGAA